MFRISAMVDSASESIAIELSSCFPEKLVIFDCETTGGSPSSHRIMEIGLIVVEHGKVIERWQQLLDPETYLPQNIQVLTGITPGMLRGQPLFEEIADTLWSYLEGRTLVAHNARFDYGFLKKEFQRIGKTYTTKPLCSVKLSRRLYPEHRRHSLDEIINRFQLSTQGRHRALGDCEMVLSFFQKISSQFDDESITSACAALVKRPSLPNGISEEDVNRIPDTPGVYYFYDANGELLYVGKSINLRTRVLSHFTGEHNSGKDFQINGRIAQIDFQLTPTDFGAQILESREVKKLEPVFNRQLRRVRKLFHFQLQVNQDGYQEVSIVPIETDSSAEESRGLFTKKSQAKAKLLKLADDYLLCHQLLGLETSTQSKRLCFRAQIKKCLGACANKEPVEQYNERVEKAIGKYEMKNWPWPGPVIVEERCAFDPDLTTYHLVDEWRYLRKLDVPEDAYELSSQDFVMEEEYDHDIHKILLRFLADNHAISKNLLRVIPLPQQRNV